MAEGQENAFITVENIAHESTVWKQLNIFWEERQFCDIIVQAENKKFHCHSNILAASSQYFKTAIKNLKENEEKSQLDVSTLSSGITLERVLHFIYTGKVLIPVEKMEDFLKESARYDIDSLQTAIDSAFTEETVTDENAMNLLVLAHNMNIASLKTYTANYICKNFERVSVKPELLDVPFDIIKDVLSRDELNAKTEEIVLDLVLKWTENKPERVDLLPEALKLVRLAFLPKKNAIDLMRHKLMRKSPAALDLAADVLDYLCEEQKNPEKLPPEVLKTRPSHNTQFRDSLILQEDENLRKTLIDLLGNKVNDTTNWKKCFTASENGFSSTSFHTNCDKKGPTVVIIKANNRIFGGYTECNWNGNNNRYEFDNNGDHFLFSVTNNVKLTVKNRMYCIYNLMNYGPTFGAGNDIYIAANAHQNTSSYSNLGNSYETAGMASTFLAGTQQFTCTEYEVYYNAK